MIDGAWASVAAALGLMAALAFCMCVIVVSLEGFEDVLQIVWRWWRSVI